MADKLLVEQEHLDTLQQALFSSNFSLEIAGGCSELTRMMRRGHVSERAARASVKAKVAQALHRLNTEYFLICETLSVESALVRLRLCSKTSLRKVLIVVKLAAIGR